MTTTLFDSARAILYGVALGDALGWPVEFMEQTEILARYGRDGITAPPEPALYTDDTQMSLAMAEALVSAGRAGLESLMAAFARNMVSWKNDPVTPTRAPGTTSIRGAAALERGAPWREAGVRDSKGCGACIRVAPIGFFYQSNLTQLHTAARSQAWLTHRHPASDAASVAAAYLVKLALDGIEPAEFPERVLALTHSLSPEFMATISRVQEALAWGDDTSALRHVGPTRGGGWIAEEAVGMALYCVMRHPQDFAAAVTLGANISGDSDSVASLAGGILGARLGPEALPADWVARLENLDYLTDVARRLAEARP